MRIAFDGTRAGIEVPDNPGFLGALRAAAIDWPFREVRVTSEPVAIVRESGNRYEVVTPEGELIEASAVSAACSVIVDFLKAYIEENPDRLCLHCGSALFDERLVIFPSRYRAGKSTLVSRLAAADHQVFGDDVLPLSDDDENGVAMGIAPRLRIPLPPKASRSFRQFIADNTGARDERYMYLKLDAARLARRGTTAPLGAIVLLDRRADGRAELLRASRSAALQALIMRNFARASEGGDLLDRLHSMTDRLPRFTLRYSDLDEATMLLEENFAQWPPSVSTLADGDPDPSTIHAEFEDGELTPIHLSTEMKLRQNPSVKLRWVDSELFLTDGEGFGIHHLNPTGAGLWRLLAEPLSQVEAVEIMCGAFPDTDRRRIEQDVAALFTALAAEGFVQPALPQISY